MQHQQDQEHTMTVSVIGLGYIGLPTAAVLASRKINVIGVDINEETVDHINKGMVKIIEPDLDILVHATVLEGYLRATTKPEAADIYIIAVPTPFKGDHEPDLSYVEAAARSIAPVLKRHDLIILESTSPVGSTEQVAQWLAEERPDLTFPLEHGECSDIRMAYCPERVMPGHVLRELVENDRVIGGLTPRCSEKATEFYNSFVQGECITTNARTAEMCKLTENSFRDVNIAFANELSMICDKLNINVWDLIRLANRHPRVNILQPGPGVGGHCIAVDPWFIVDKTPEDAKLIAMAREVNNSKSRWVLKKVQEAIENLLESNFEKTARDITIGCLGLTFKADIDDLRESPALGIVTQLVHSHHGPIIIVEPNINELPDELKSASLGTMQEAFAEADIIVVLVDHKLFKAQAREILSHAVVIDLRGLWHC